jgi:PEP-CTERM motif
LQIASFNLLFLLKVFMITRLLSFFFLGCFLMVNSAHAAVATYTLSGGKISGTLGGNPFSDADFTITADADPDNFVPGSFGGFYPYPMLSQLATSTMTIDGIATFQITSPGFGVFLSDFSFDAPGVAFGGFGFDLDTTESAGFAATGVVPSLSGNVTITGELSLSEDVPFTTDAGVLVVTDFSDFGATFTGEFSSSAIPEPTSMAIFGLGSLGMAYRARRKLKA